MIQTAVCFGGLSNSIKNVINYYRQYGDKTSVYCLDVPLNEIFVNLNLTLENPQTNNFNWRFIILEKDNLPAGFSKFNKNNEYPFITNNGNSAENIDFEFERIPVNITNDILSHLFKLEINTKIMQVVNEFSKIFNENTVSMHIRCWLTNKLSEQYQCKYRFENLYHLDKYIHIIKNHLDKKFFIATDNEQIKQYVSNECTNVIFFERNPELTNFQNDFIDLLLLSKNKVLYGSATSTFTELAWYYSNCTQKVIFP